MHENYSALCPGIHASIHAAASLSALQDVENRIFDIAVHLSPLEAADLILTLSARRDLLQLQGAGPKVKKSVLAACRRIIKSSIKMPYMWQAGERFAVCDGFRGIRLNYDIPELPHPDFTDNLFRIDETMAPVIKAAGDPFPLPTAKEVRAWIREEKAAGRIQKGGRAVYLLACGSAVNAAYLIDILEALPRCTAYTPVNDISMIYFKSADGDAVLCPVRQKKT